MRPSLEAGITIAATVAVAAVLLAVALAIKKQARADDDQKAIARLRFAVVATTRVETGSPIEESQVVRRLVRTADTAPSPGERVLTDPAEAVGKICASALDEGVVLTSAMVTSPSAPASPANVTVLLPVTVKEELAAGLAVGESVAFTKEGTTVPQPGDGPFHGYEIVDRLQNQAQSPGERTVTLTVEVPATDLDAASALASEGWHPMRVKTAPAGNG